MPVSPQAEALVQLARKRRILDRSGCARLRVLLAERKVDTPAKARQFLEKAKLLPVGPAQQLLSHLPPDEGMDLGPYRVLAHLADGGMGSVWLATRDAATARKTPLTEAPTTPQPARPLPEPGELVVVKTMKGQFAGVDEVRHRFEREFRFMAELRHPSVVAILDHGAATDGTLFMVLAFVESGDLKELVENQGPLPEALALAFVHQVADALDAAHTRKLIHRDIKPANIFASPEGVCQLADFGIARSTAAERTMLTMEGTLVGSPAYMSPEQVLAEKDLDIRSDLYALGCVLYFCLAGTEPYKGRLQEVLHQHRTAPIPDPRTNRPEITEKTSVILKRLMAKKREDRYQVPAELRTAIAEALAVLGTGSTAAPVSQHSEDHTIAADLLAENDTGHESRATVVVPPEGAVNADATIAVSGAEWAGAAAAPSGPAAAAGSDRVQGDFGSALDQPWIALVGDGCHVLLYGRRQLTMGKLCEPPVDICLRKYPTTQFRDDCLRISRQHLQLRFDAPTSRLLLGDLGSGNGTVLDDAPMPPNSPIQIEPGRDYHVTPATSLRLTLRTRPRQGGAVANLAGAGAGDSAAACGIDCAHAFDMCSITRADNRPGMAYALVLRRLTLGAVGADIVLPGTSGTAAEIALFRNRWLWRAVGSAAWQPIADGTPVSAGGKFLKARVGGYDLFQTEF